MGKHIRFDWAMKRLLRNKANFDVLEGFLTVLLNEKVKIKTILESESNKETEEDKSNRLDMLVENEKGDLILIEVQVQNQRDYFHRMNYGQAKLLTEYISEGDSYDSIKKIYSINIVYFDLGQGKDYVYEGKTEFIGMRIGDVLELSSAQKVAYSINSVSDIFTKYYIIKVNKFDDYAKDSLDEWIYFFKHSEIKEEFNAPGLKEAKERLKKDNLSKSEKEAYEWYIKQRRIQESEIKTALQEGELKARNEYLPLIEEAKKREKEAKKREEEERKQKEEALNKVRELAKFLKEMNVPIEQIVEKTGLSEEDIKNL